MGSPPKYKPGGAPSSRKTNDERTGGREYKPPAIANPGNVIQETYTTNEVAEMLASEGYPGDVLKRNVGGGRMGSKLAHENEAPFPEALAEFYVKSFCPPSGVVLDIFSGSGSTLAAAVKNGRNFIAFDLRADQIELSKRRHFEAIGL